MRWITFWIFAATTGLYAALEIILPIPIPEKYPGIRISNGSSDVRLEVFLDLNCGDSAHAWNVLKQLRDGFPGRLEIVLHSFPLPYHPFAFICAQSLFLVEDLSPDHLENFIDAVFANIGRFNGGATRFRTAYAIHNYLAQIVQSSTGIPASTFRSRSPSYERKAAARWKYGARRGVAGTPWFFLNGVDLGLDPSLRLNVQHWIGIISEMID